MQPNFMHKLAKIAYGTLARNSIRPVVGAIVKIFSTALSLTPGMPIFYFHLPNMNTGTLLTLHVLRKIQTSTDRRIIVISSWPFWPPETSRDQFFTSFIRELTPKFHYIWIPVRIQNSVRNLMSFAARLVQRHDDLYRHVRLTSTFRYGNSSTMLHVDILNHGNRVPMQIPKSHERSLESEMRSLGIPKDGWFVCAHAREHGWQKELNAYNLQMPAGYRYEQEDHRNVDIEDYYPAFEHIVSMGGTVIRMGDPSMKPVARMKGVIDYPFTEHKSFPMDLYLVSKCSFVLGCNSGFSDFAEAFCIPVLQTNMTSPANSARFPYSNNIFLFQHILDIGTGTRLELNRMFDSNLITINDPFHFEELGYRTQSNSPEDILKATQEMLHLVKNNSFDGPRSQEQELFHQLRLKALDSLWSVETDSGNDLYSKLSSSQSRISASFAERYLSDRLSSQIA